MSAKDAPQKDMHPTAIGGFCSLKRLIRHFLLQLKRILFGKPKQRHGQQSADAAQAATPVHRESPDKSLSAYPECVFEPATLPADVEARLEKVDWSQRDVLVGTLRSAAQLKACIDNTFYYIPAPLVTEDDLPIRYVALFQTPRVFPGNAGIFCYGEIVHSALVRRGSIREVPQTHGTPGDLYYRYRIRRWIFLPAPIRPKEAGFVRAFTNRFLLEHAEYIPELLLCSETEFRFYTELKHRTNAAISNSAAVSGFSLGTVRVLLADGTIQVFQNGTAVSICTILEFSQRPGATLRMLLSGCGGNDPHTSNAAR